MALRIFLADNGVLSQTVVNQYKFDVLVSYAFKDKCLSRLNGGARIFLDSGAYSVWRRGESINLYEYKDFISRYQTQIEFAANLDVIPGSPGKVLSFEDIEKSAFESLVNYKFLKRYFDDMIVPVFHQNERFYWLQSIIKETSPQTLIAISPANDQGVSSRNDWLEDCWLLLCDSKGKPIRKVHGFGVTSPSLIWQYPWYSVDSSTPSQIARFGDIFEFDKSSKIVRINLGQRVKDPLPRDIKSTVKNRGFDLHGLVGRHNVKNRIAYNALVLRECLLSKRSETYYPIQGRLFI